MSWVGPLNIDVATQGETSIDEGGNIEEITSSYIIFWKGKAASGSGFVVKTRLIYLVIHCDNSRSVKKVEM